MTYDLAMTYLTIAAMVIFVLFPVLILATVTAVHAVRRWQPTFTPTRTVSYARPMAPRQLADPATA